MVLQQAPVTHFTGNNEAEGVLHIFKPAIAVDKEAFFVAHLCKCSRLQCSSTEQGAEVPACSEDTFSRT